MIKDAASRVGFVCGGLIIPFSYSLSSAALFYLSALSWETGQWFLEPVPLACVFAGLQSKHSEYPCSGSSRFLPIMSEAAQARCGQSVCFSQCWVQSAHTWLGPPRPWLCISSARAKFSGRNSGFYTLRNLFPASVMLQEARVRKL